MSRFFVLALLAVSAACASAPAPQPVNQSTAAKGPQQAAPTPPGMPAGQTPAGSAGASANAPNEPMDDKVAELKTAYEKNPGDAAAKKVYAKATFDNAEFYMYNSPLPPNQKYPKALALYRTVLTLEPDNTKASESVAMIEGIYRQMGKPVPAA